MFVLFAAEGWGVVVLTELDGCGVCDGVLIETTAEFKTTIASNGILSVELRLSLRLSIVTLGLRTSTNTATGGGGAVAGIELGEGNGTVELVTGDVVVVDVDVVENGDAVVDVDVVVVENGDAVVVVVAAGVGNGDAVCVVGGDADEGIGVKGAGVARLAAHRRGSRSVTVISATRKYICGAREVFADS